MKTVSVRELQKHIRESVDASQHDHVVITRHGQPTAVLLGVEGKDWETLFWETNSSLWKTLARRRGEETVSLAEMRRRVSEK